MTDPAAPDRLRLLAAFAAIPFVDALLAFAAFSLLRGSSDAAFGFAVLTGVIGLLVTVCGGIPVVWSLRKEGRLSLRQLLLAGLALGNAPFAVYALMIGYFALVHLINGTLAERLLPMSELLRGTAVAIAIGSAMGMASAAVFWVVGVSGDSRAG